MTRIAAVRRGPKPKKAPIKKELPPLAKIRCYKCGAEYNSSARSFFNSFGSRLWEHEGHLPVCRSCLEEMFTDYTAKLRGEEPALKRICQKFDYYYSHIAVEKAKQMRMNETEKGSLLSVYLKVISRPEYKTKSYESTLVEEEAILARTIQSPGDLDAAAVLSSPESEVEEISDTSDELFARWGAGFTHDEYLSMQQDYEDWMTRYIIEGKNKEQLVQGMCIARVLMFRALQEGNTDQYNKSYDTWRKMMSDADLSPKAEKAIDKENEIPLGKMIERFENERPIPKPNPEWEDVDGIKKFITVYFLGHLCEMLDIKSRYAKMYEEEMDKYRAVIPELEGSDDDDVLDYLLREGDETNGETLSNDQEKDEG